MKFLRSVLSKRKICLPVVKTLSFVFCPFPFALCFLLITFCPKTAKCQEPTVNYSCGISEEARVAIGERLLKNRADFKNTTFPRADVYVPVYFHLVAKSDGSGRVKEQNVLDMLCEWNRIYAANGLPLQFYIKGLNYINDDNAFDKPSALSGDAVIRDNRKTDGMNVYLTNATRASTVITVAAYYDPSQLNDWIIMLKSLAGTGGGITIGHEAGHFYSLPHPFNGWESGFFKATAAAPCAPLYSSGGSVLTERVSRDSADRNCLTAGDYLCDTQADYGEGNSFAGGCVWSGIDKDPKCVGLQLEPKNIMGYFVNCSSLFSEDQKTAIKNDYFNNARRKYVRDGNIAQSTTEIGTYSLTSPINKAVIAYNSINLNWTPTVGATSYIVEVSQYSSFEISPRRFVVTTNSFTLDNTKVEAGFLAPNTDYFWRIRGFSPYKTCSSFSSTGQFSTGAFLLDVNQIQGVNSFTIQPNPANSESGFVDLSISTVNAFSATIKIIDLSGKVQSNQSEKFFVGLNTKRIATKNLAQGIYIVSVESEQGVMNQKLMVN